ncbi:hypothetical protein [Kribbella sp. NPDC006257]|uniref:hypothetical protein n=1 Tax=Kribbella sp. NPDC006257 TaxID=3156738 RepID=UPI0033A2ADEC
MNRLRSRAMIVSAMSLVRPAVRRGKPDNPLRSATIEPVGQPIEPLERRATSYSLIGW